jgi:hypothetical protein
VAVADDGAVDEARTAARRRQMAAANAEPATYDRGEPG